MDGRKTIVETILGKNLPKQKKKYTQRFKQLNESQQRKVQRKACVDKAESNYLKLKTEENFISN